MKRMIGWIVLVTLLLAVVLVPFGFFGQAMEKWVAEFRQSPAGATTAALVLGGLLAGDFLLPVPSSVASTALGYFLGFSGGTAVSLAAMTLSSLAGYAIGRWGGRPVAMQLVGEPELERFHGLSSAWGDWFIVATRPVPVLAEGAAFFAGIAKMRLGRFLALSTLANLGISAAYGAIGAYSYSTNSFLLAFAGAMALPGLAMLAWRALARRRG